MWGAVQVSHSLCIMRGVPRGDERGGVLHVALLLPANLPITPLHLVGCPPVRVCLPVQNAGDCGPPTAEAPANPSALFSLAGMCSAAVFGLVVVSAASVWTEAVEPAGAAAAAVLGGAGPAPICTPGPGVYPDGDVPEVGATVAATFEPSPSL
jgi:hypothetical protein